MYSDSDYVTLEPQRYCGSKTFDELGGRRIDELSILFNIPVDELASKFLNELEASRADKTFENDYDDFDIFHLKCKKALENVLNPRDSRIRKGRADDAVAENIGEAYSREITDWKDMAQTWLAEWLRLYNSNLRYYTDEVVTDLLEVVEKAVDNPRLTEDDIRHLTEIGLSEAINGRTECGN